MGNHISFLQFMWMKVVAKSVQSDCDSMSRKWRVNGRRKRNWGKELFRNHNRQCRKNDSREWHFSTLHLSTPFFLRKLSHLHEFDRFPFYSEYFMPKLHWFDVAGFLRKLFFTPIPSLPFSHSDRACTLQVFVIMERWNELEIGHRKSKWE